MMIQVVVSCSREIAENTTFGLSLLTKVAGSRTFPATEKT